MLFYLRSSLQQPAVLHYLWDRENYETCKQEIIYFMNVLAEIPLIQELKHFLETKDKETR